MKRLLLLVVCAVSFSGCLYKDEPGATSEATTPAAKEDGAKPDEPAKASTDTTTATPTPGTSAQTTTTPAPVETIQKKAAVGATGKGQYGEGAGFITTPISVYFQAKEKLTYDNVFYALKLWQAEHGTYPKSHDEFMEVIIKPNNIQLPKLPEGHKYIYDPESHTLMVEQPK